MNVFKNTPGRMVLLGWIYPFIGVVITLIMYYMSGCTGGYIDSALECKLTFYEELPIFQVYQVIATIYLTLTFIIYVPIFLVAVVRAFQTRSSSTT